MVTVLLTLRSEGCPRPGFSREGSRWCPFALLLFLNLLVAPFLSPPPLAGTEYRELELERHLLIYPQEAQEFALEVSRALSLLAPLEERYRFYPEGRSLWILKPDKLSFNGLAFHPWQRIELWGTMSFFELRGFSPWVSNVVFHEFAHLSTLPLANRFYPRMGGILLGGEGRVRALKGNTGVLYLYPSENVPRWFSEGLAQYEAELLKGDRWDPTRRTFERLRFLHGKLLTLEEMATVEEKGYLHAEAVYNQGYSFVRFLGQRYGVEKLQEVLEDQGTHLFRGFTSSLEAVYGMPITLLTQGWHEEIRSTVEEDLRRLKATPQGVTIPSPPYVVALVLSPQGEELAMIAEKDGNDPEGRLVLAPVSDPAREEQEVARGVVDPPAYSPDGKTLYFVRSVRTLGEEELHLFAYDGEAKTRKELLPGKRLRYPAHHPRGATLFVAIMNPGALDLGSLSLTTPELSRHTHLPWGWEMRELRFSPQGILYGVLVHGREVDLFRLSDPHHPESLEILPWEGSEEHHPVVDQEGRLWFISDESGSFQLYSLEGTTARVHTGVPGGVFGFAVLPQGELLLRVAELDRFELRRLSLEERRQGVPLPEKGGFIPFPLPQRPSSPPLPDRPHSFRLLPPLFYPEFLYQGNRFTAGVLALVGDDLGEHELELEGLIGSFSGLHLRYLYSGWTPLLSLEGDHYRWLQPTSLGVGELAIPLPIEYQVASARAILPLVPGFASGVEVRANRYRGEFVTEELPFLQGEDASLFLLLHSTPPYPLSDLDFRGVSLYLASTLRSAQVLFDPGVRKRFLYPRLYGSFQYARPILGFTLEARGFWGWIMADVPPIEEFFLGGEIFFIRRGIFQTFAQMPGYPDFYFHGEKLLLFRPALRRILVESPASLGPLRLTAVGTELALDLGNTFPQAQSWAEVLSTLVREPRFLPQGSQGLFGDLTLDLRLRFLVQDAYPWVSFFRVAYGFQDPEKRQGALPLRFHIGLGAELP